MTHSSIQLHNHDFIHTSKIEPGSTLVCEKGTVWLTRSNDPKDYMLEPGDRMVVNAKSNLLIQALSESRLSIVHSN